MRLSWGLLFLFFGKLMAIMGDLKARSTLWFSSLLLLGVISCSTSLPAPMVISSSPDGIVLRQYLVSNYGQEVHKRDLHLTLFAEEHCWSVGKDAILIHKTTIDSSYVLYSYECQFNRGLPHRGLREPLSIY